MKFLIGFLLFLTKNGNASYNFEDDFDFDDDYALSQRFSFGSFDYSDRTLFTEVPTSVEDSNMLEYDERNIFSTLSPTGSPTGAPTEGFEQLTRSLPEDASNSETEFNNKFILTCTFVIISTIMGAML